MTFAIAHDLRSQTDILQYHDDGETGLGPTVATYSLGAPAAMRFRLKGQYYTGVRMKRRNGKEHDEESDADEGDADAEGGTRVVKAKTTAKDKQKAMFFLAEEPLPNTLDFEARKAAFESLAGLTPEERDKRCWEIPHELGLKFKKGSPALLNIHLAHGDKVIMHGEAIQKYFEVTFRGYRLSQGCTDC